MMYIGQSLIALDERSCHLKWNPSTDEDLDGYYVYMSEITDTKFKRATPERILTPEWVSPPLRRDTKYFFYVTAVDTSDNESSPSSTVEFYLPDATPDLYLIPVLNPRTITIEENSSTTEKLSSDFMVGFEWEVSS